MPTQRQSNIELLRIFAILMVVMGHFIRQSGLLESETGINSTVNVLFGSGGRIAVNVFLLIGSWFMVDSTFRPGKALRLYLETVFYCIPITLLMICLGIFLWPSCLVCFSIHITNSSHTIPQQGVSTSRQKTHLPCRHSFHLVLHHFYNPLFFDH